MGSRSPTRRPCRARGADGPIPGGLAPAGFVRIAGETVGIGLIIPLLLAGPVYDWLTQRRIYGAYIWGIAITLLSSPAFSMLAETAAWQKFARTLVE